MDDLKNNPNYPYWTAPYHTGHIDPVIFIYEEYRPFIEMPDKYLISNCGKIINLKTNYHVIPEKLNKGGYLRVNCIGDNGYHKRYLVHRMVMMTFDPRPNQDELEVNHLNGIKDQNIYLPGHPWHNLEWCTPSENIQHAIKTGLIPIGEDNGKAVRTNEEIHKICQILQENPNISYREVANLLNTEYNDAFINLVSSIVYKRYWTHISDLYNIIHYDRTKNSDELIHNISRLLAQDLTTRQIANILNVDYTEKFVQLVSGIRRKVHHREISKLYF